MVQTVQVSYSNNTGQSTNPQSWGAQSLDNGNDARKKRSGRGWKILLAVVVVLAILIAVAEFGVRAYAKNTVVDELRSSAEQEGVELADDPSVSFGTSPLLLGLLQGTIPSMEMTLPSSLDVSYEDSDQSRPVVSGQPEMRVNASDMDMDSDDPTVRDITVDTVLPPEFLLAEIQRSEAEGGDGGDGDDAGNIIEGLIEVSDVRMDAEANTLELDITGGLATLSMTPVVQDGALTFEVGSLRILGMELPDTIVDQLTDELQDTVNDVEGMQIQSAEVTEEGLAVQLHGTDVRLNEISVNTAGTAQDDAPADQA